MNRRNRTRFRGLEKRGQRKGAGVGRGGIACRVSMGSSSTDRRMQKTYQRQGGIESRRRGVRSDREGAIHTPTLFMRTGSRRKVARLDLRKPATLAPELSHEINRESMQTESESNVRSNGKRGRRREERKEETGRIKTIVIICPAH